MGSARISQEDPASTRASKEQTRRTRPSNGNAGPTRFWDLAVAVLVALLAAYSSVHLAAASLPRLALAALVVFVVPGYLLLQLLFPGRRHGPQRAADLVVALGASPAVVGLAALATAAVPGGFRPGIIVASVTTACVALAVGAWFRRRREAKPRPGAGRWQTGGQAWRRMLGG